MKVYIKSATNVADIEAKIANKQAFIDKKKVWIDKKEANIKKKLDILSKKLSPEDYNQLVLFIDNLKTTYRSKIPRECEFNTWGYRREHNWSWESPEGKAIDTIDDDAESIYNSNKAIKEAEAVLEKYNTQLNAVKQKEKQIDEIPNVLKDFMNQLIDEWDRYDLNIKEKSPQFYKELKAKSEAIISFDLRGKEKIEKLLELYPRWAERYERADNYDKSKIRWVLEDTFEDEYLKIPFKKEFGMSIDAARNLWYMSEEEIHKANVKAGKNVILDLTNRVTKITGPITSYAGLHLTQGNGGWAVLNGFVEGENGKASVETILAGGWNVQKLHCRTLVKPIK